MGDVINWFAKVGSVVIGISFIFMMLVAIGVVLSRIGDRVRIRHEISEMEEDLNEPYNY